MKKSKPKHKSSEPTRFEAIGTQWSLEVFDGDTVPHMVAIHKLIDQFDENYSRFRADSLVTKMSQQAGSYQLPADAQPLFDLYHELYELTSGAMTPLIGQTLADAGYDSTYSLQPKPLVQPPSWQAALDYDFPQLTLHKPALLDVGAAGKGYLVDLVGELLEARGVKHYCVDAGGDMRVRCPEPLQIGLEHPTEVGQAIGVANMQQGSLCGSAGNRRAWGAYHHILNPQTLESPRDTLAIWVVADTTLLADALTTALFFVSPEVLHKRYTFSYARVASDFSLERSADFPAKFFA